VVASFPAHAHEQLMLVTDQAKLIRMGLDTLRVIGRGSAGVRLFHVADDEHVVSAARIDEEENPEDAAEEAVAEEMAEIGGTTPDDGATPEAED
jgi:DNA gyrase subunit A